MAKPQFIVAILTLSCLMYCGHSMAGSPTSSPSVRLPPVAESFRDKVKQMNADDMQAEAKREFGEPRDIGSGLSVPEWHIAGGDLIIHPLRGPTFRFADGKLIWLLPTSNAAQENLLQDFEMDTPPDPKMHGNQFWIGNVQISKDQHYQYVDSDSNLHNREDQSGNFFIHHPEGHIEIIWPKGIDAKSHLEDLGNREVARIRFVATDGKSTLEAGIKSSDQTRTLTLSGATYELQCGWKHYWLTQR